METIFVSFSKSDFQDLLAETVSACLRRMPCHQVTSEADQLLTVQQAAEFLTLSVPTVYGLISKGSLPCMKRSKRVYFSQQELISYLKQGKRKTLAEIESEADAFLSTQKRKGGGYAK